jgi:hypothetical protein
MPVPPLPLQGQRVALAALLCGPSQLRQSFDAQDDAESAAGVRRELVALGFSDLALDVAMLAVRQIRNEPGLADAVRRVRDGMKRHVWGGQEPHPPPTIAPAIVGALRAIDAAEDASSQ